MKIFKIKKKFEITYLIFIALLFFSFLFLTSCTNIFENDPKLKEIKQRGKLIVGTSPPYGIMEFYNDNKEIVGFDIDLAKKIADYLNVDLELKDIDFDKFEDALNNNEIDLMIASITITYDRQQRMEFSQPYFNGGQALVANLIYNSYDLLEGKKIMIEDDSSDFKKEVFNIIGNFTPVFYSESQGLPYFEKALEEISSNNIDAFVIDYIAAIDAVKKNDNLIILGVFTDEYYGIAAKKGNKKLIQKVDEVILNLKETEELEEMKNKWLTN